jgi:hypothetical protein
MHRFRLIAFTFSVFLAATACAQMPQPFSADMTSNMSNGQKMTGKVYLAAPNMRVDMTSMPDASGGDRGAMFGNVSVIVDGKAQTSYMLMPKQQMFMEFHGQGQGRMHPAMREILSLHSGDPCASDPDRTCKKTGTDTVGGRACDVWEVTSKTGGKGTVCIDQRLHFPLRVTSDRGDVTEFTNIKEGAQDPALFRVPAGYKPFDPSAFGGQRRQH